MDHVTARQKEKKQRIVHNISLYYYYSNPQFTVETKIGYRMYNKGEQETG